MTIVGATLCMLLAKSAESAEHLAEGLAISKEMLDEGAQMWFEERKKGDWQHVRPLAWIDRLRLVVNCADFQPVGDLSAIQIEGS